MHLRHSIDGIIKNVTYGDNYLIGKQLVQSGNSLSLYKKRLTHKAHKTDAALYQFWYILELQPKEHFNAYPQHMSST